MMMPGKNNVVGYGTGTTNRTLKNMPDLSLDLPVLIDSNDYRNKLK